MTVSGNLILLPLRTELGKVEINSLMFIVYRYIR
jgi:hypothetical protein